MVQKINIYNIKLYCNNKLIKINKIINVYLPSNTSNKCNIIISLKYTNMNF